MNRTKSESRRAGRYIPLAISLNVALALAGGATSALAATDTGSSSHYVADAKNYLAKGQLKAAEIQLKNALRDNPNDLDARITLGIVSMREGDAGGAEHSFKIALQQSGSQAQVLPMLGQSYLMQGKTRELLDEIKPDGLTPDAAAQIADLRARAYMSEKDPDDARKEAEKALSLQPEMPDALITLAFLSRQRGDVAGAESLVDRALKAKPDDALALDVKGQLRATQNDPTAALDIFKKALAARPDDVNARLGEASALLALGQIEPARHDVDDVLTRIPGQPQAIYLRAVMLEREGKYAEALATIEPAAASLDDAVAAQILLGELNLRANHIEKAQAYAQHVLSLAPTLIAGKILLGLVYARLDQPQKVIDLLAPVAAESPENAQVEMVVGDAYGRLGRFDAAAKALEIASRQNPSDSDLRTSLDASRIGAGDREAGMKDLTSLLQADPQAKRASILLVSSTMNLGHLAEAEKIATELRDSQPGNPLIDNLLGRIHWMMGDWAAAEANFQSALHKQPLFLDAANNLVLMRQLRGESDEADALYGAVLKVDAKNTQAMIDLAGAAHDRGDEDHAVSWLEKASAAAPDSAQIHVRLIDLLLTQKKDQQALTTAQALDSTGHDAPEITDALARAQLAMGQQDSAIISLRHLAELNPNAAQGQFQLGQALAVLNRPDDALAAYRKAVESDPAYLPAWQALVTAEARTAGMDQSLATIKQAMTHSALAPYEDFLKGDAYLAAKRYADAKAAFQSGLKHAPTIQLMMGLGAAQSQSGDTAGMIATLSDWMKTHPDDTGVRAAYAEALMANKDVPGAEREYLALLATNPMSVGALNNLAWLYTATDPAKALKYANLSFGLAPQSPQVRDTLAWILLQQGNIATATILLRMAHAQSPADPEIAYHLAMSLSRAGDANGARALVTPLAQSSVAFASQDDARELLHKLDKTN